ncbi:hypothetical protein [Dictyobacter aurantiacus]|nr:hypothetical protein [Dictyobacter aurantiacus]
MGTKKDAMMERVRAQLQKSVERLQSLQARPSNDQAQKQAMEHELLSALSAVKEALPPDIQAQVQQLLMLHTDLSSPYIGRATSMTQLHQRNAERSDLPGWAQPE